MADFTIIFKIFIKKDCLAATFLFFVCIIVAARISYRVVCDFDGIQTTISTLAIMFARKDVALDIEICLFHNNTSLIIIDAYLTIYS